MASIRGRTAWVASALSVILLAGGCTGTEPRQGTEPSASLAALGPLLPMATSEADLTVDRGLAAALDKEFASGEYKDLRSVIVLADGRTAYERYFQSGPTDYHHVFSVTKSVISTLIGIAIADGAISGVDATLAELLPDRAGDMTKSVAGTTLEQLLTMMGGFTDEDPGPTVTDWVADILNKQALDPGSGFAYSSNSVHLVSAILAEATGHAGPGLRPGQAVRPAGDPQHPRRPAEHQ